MTADRVRELLQRVTFAPSGLKSICWQWEVRTLLADTQNFVFRVAFKRPNTETGENGIGYGRWWVVPEDSSDDGVVKSAFAACKMIIEHELMEAFMFDGVRIFDPHHSIADLSAAADSKADRWIVREIP